MTGTKSAPKLSAAIVLCYATLISFGIFHHEPWIDEVDSWVAARDMSVAALFSGHTNNMGHPALWYLILMPFAKAGLPLETLYVVHGLIAIGTVAVFVRYAPFPLLLKILWVFSVPVAYHYGVVARNYSLTALLLFSAAALYPQRVTRPFTYAIAVFLLLQTHAFVFITGCALVACYAWELWRQKPWNGKQLAALAIMAAGVAAALYQLWPSEDHAKYFPNTLKPDAFFIMIFGGWLPEVYRLNNYALVMVWLALLPVSWLFLAPFLFDRKKIPLAVLAASFGWLWYVVTFKYAGLAIRHAEIAICLFFFALWLAAHYPSVAEHSIKHPQIKRLALLSIYLCLFYSCILTPFQYYIDYKHPFSASQDVRDFLVRSRLQDRSLILDGSYSLTGYFPRGCCWVPYSGRFQSSITWDNAYWWYDDIKFKRDERNERLMPGLAAKYFGDLSGKLYVSIVPLNEQERRKYDLVIIYGKTEAMNLGYMESMYVYVTKDTLKEIAPQLRPVP